MKQKEEESNKDFINSFQQEVKVYKKHSRKRFLWSTCLDEQVEDFVLNNNTKLESTKEEKKEAKKNFRDGLEKKIMAIAILKRTDKKR